MNNKQETSQIENFLSIYTKYKDYTEDLEMNMLDQQKMAKIFDDYWGPVIEDYWFLILQFPLKELMYRLERIIIISALSKFEGNQKKTADFLRMKPTTLNEKVKRFNIFFRKIPDTD